MLQQSRWGGESSSTAFSEWAGQLAEWFVLERVQMRVESQRISEVLVAVFAVRRLVVRHVAVFATFRVSDQGAEVRE